MIRWKSLVRLSTVLCIISSLSPLALVGLLHPVQAATSFTFAAVGDLGGIASGTGTNCTNNGALFGATNAGSCAYQVLNSISGRAPGFLLALGDLAYHDQSPSDWCSTLNNTSIFTGIARVALVTGNHDTSNSGTITYPAGSAFAADLITNEAADGFLDDSTNNGVSYAGYVSACGAPAGISWVPSGTSSNFLGCHADLSSPSCYAREYYFDYPPSNPIMRFIVISAGICGAWFNAATGCPTSNGTVPAGYSGWTASSNCPTLPPFPSGSEHYCWLKNRIDEAHNSGMWVAVANHKQCVSNGDNTCQSTFDPFNLGIMDGVDLWLDGHDHTYQRSYQLCSSATGSVNAAKCLASSAPCTGSASVFTNCGLAGASQNNPYDGTSANAYVKGSGTIVNIIGTGGGGTGLSIVCGGGSCPYSSPALFASGCGSNGTSGGSITSLCDSSSTCLATTPKSCGDVGYMSFSVDTSQITANWVRVACSGKTNVSNCSFSDSYTMKVNPQDFSVYGSPTTITVAEGNSQSVNVNLNSFSGFADTVTLTASPPSGLTTSFSPSSVVVPSGGTGGPSILTISASTSALIQTYVVTIVATSSPSTGSISHSFRVSVKVTTSGGGSGGGSVASGTLITMNDGSGIPVQNLNTGDGIVMYDVYSGRSLRATIASIRLVEVGNMLTIYTGNNAPLRVDANPKLRFYVMTTDGPTLKPVTMLQRGDLLYNYDLGKWVPVSSVTTVFGGNHAYYDLTTSPMVNANGQFLSFIANGIADPCTSGCKDGPSP